MLCLSERKHRGGSKKVPPFSSVSVTTVNGTVESGGVTVVGAGNNILRLIVTSNGFLGEHSGQNFQVL